MDKSREDFIERWVRYMKKNPEWKKIHTKFIDAQFEKAYNFIERTLKEENGSEIIAKIYKIKNKKGYPSIFKDSRKL